MAAAVSDHRHVAITSSACTPAVKLNRSRARLTSLRTWEESSWDTPYMLSTQTAAEPIPASRQPRATARGRGGALGRGSDMRQSHHGATEDRRR